jgi:hypothetical protein
MGEEAAAHICRSALHDRMDTLGAVSSAKRRSERRRAPVASVERPAAGRTPGVLTLQNHEAFSRHLRPATPVARAEPPRPIAVAWSSCASAA